MIRRQSNRIIVLVSTFVITAIVLTVSYQNNSHLQVLLNDYRFLAELRFRRAFVPFTSSFDALRAETNEVERSLGKKKKNDILHPVWEIGYPFAGSNVLIGMVQGFTGKSMATNYGDVIFTNSGPLTGYDSVPINKGMPNGPYKYHHSLPLPNKGNLILTKTHCSGHCIDYGDGECNVKDIVNPLTDVSNYFEACASGTKFTMHGGYEEIIKYNPWLSQKVIVVIRNPLMIIYSRFINYMEGRSDDRYVMNAKGMKKWCEDIDNMPSSNTILNWYKKESKALVGERVQCHTEIWKIAQFYNMVFKLIKFLEEPHLEVYFEDYDVDPFAQMDKVLGFLEYKDVKNLKAAPWETHGNDGSGFFDTNKALKMLKLFNLEATEDTKQAFSRYGFEHGRPSF